jgi:hypothetical protein
MMATLPLPLSLLFVAARCTSGVLSIRLVLQSLSRPRRPQSFRFFQIFLPRIIRSFDWFVIGERETVKEVLAENPPLQNVIVRN